VIFLEEVNEAADVGAKAILSGGKLDLIMSLTGIVDRPSREVLLLILRSKKLGVFWRAIVTTAAPHLVILVKENTVLENLSTVELIE